MNSNSNKELNLEALNLEALNLEALSEKQERLLMRYFDGEANLLERIYARRLISKPSSAKCFVGELKQVHTSTREYMRSVCKEAGIDKVDLWDSVDARIEQEERAQIYLGERKFSESDNRVFNNRVSDYRASDKGLYPRLVWSLSGATVAACATFFVMNFGVTSGSRDFPASADRFASSNNTESARLVSNQASHLGEVKLASTSGSSTVSNPSSSSPSSISRERLERYYTKRAARRSLSSPRKVVRARLAARRGKSVDFDWMRSDGRVTFIQDMQQGSTIVWINRDLARNKKSKAASVSDLSSVSGLDTISAQERKELKNANSIFDSEAASN